jgi:translation initiation factor IF-2
LATKRIHNIAKELGIDSKAIIAKCVAEGVPADKVQNHMAIVSPGLEASIKEWFSTASGVSTAVEQTAHVDVEAVRAAAPKRATRSRTTKGGDKSGGEGDVGVAIEPDAPADELAPAPKPRPAARRVEAAPTSPAPEPAAGHTAGHAAGPEPVEAPTPVHPESAPEPTRAAPLSPQAQPPAPKPASRPDSGDAGAAKRPAAVQPPPAAPPAHPKSPPVSPAPMNVPLRPKVVAPAGPKLEVKAAVKLSGPKVVRIEAPEVIDRPRPRRDAGGPGSMDPGAPRGGAGAGARTDDDDSGRSPRRNTGAAAKRRPGATGPGSAGPGEARGVPPRRRGRSDEPPAGGMWREQDLIEREARLSRAEGYLKQRRQQLRKQGGAVGERAQSAAETGGKVRIVAPFTIKDLSAATGVKVSDIVKKLFMQGVMATANSGIDTAKAAEIMIDFEIELDVVEAKSAEEVVSSQFVDRKQVSVRPRGPIVTILGHVDHGKTSLLDKIRNANVAAGEAGGITQATSAFRVPVAIAGETKHILFLDTPGHEAFTSMRSRGAQVTDIVVLVVSAPEGVAPQTIESINHAKAAKVPIVVALNKIDRPDATDGKINQTLSELAAQGLNPSEWGGDTDVIRTSATKGIGIDKLLETLDLQGQMLDLKADYGGPARGTVVEARLEEGRGAVANVIVQDGELKVGDFIVIGRAFGKVRDIVDDRGQRHKSVGPAMPVQISGFDSLPDAGDKFYIVESLKQAQEAAEQRRQRERETQLAQPKVTLDSLLSQMKDASVKEILIVLKADVQGSVDVLKNEIERVGTKEVKVRVLHNAVGGISESDVLLADASRAIIIGFNVIASNKARQLAEAKGVEIRTYQVIYEITDDVRKAAEGLLEPERKTQILGHAEVRQVFRISKIGTIAGCYVTDGVVQRDALIRVTRNGVVIENDRVLEQLKRFKDDAKEVKANMECGMKIVGYDDIKDGDVLECYKNVEVKRTL